MHIFTPDKAPPQAGILFAEDFDDAPAPLCSVAVEHEPDIIAPNITAEDIADARSDGFAAGQRAARDEAAQRLQDAARQSCERVGELALRAEAMRESQLAEATEAAARLIFAALAAVLPSLSAHHGSNEIVHLVRNILTGLTPEKGITISVAPETLAPLRDALATTPRHIARRITLTGDDAMVAGDARLTWEGGAASRQAKRAEDALADILTSLDLLPHAAPPNAEPHSAIPSSAPHSLETTHG